MHGRHRLLPLVIVSFLFLIALYNAASVGANGLEPTDQREVQERAVPGLVSPTFSQQARPLMSTASQETGSPKTLRPAAGKPSPEESAFQALTPAPKVEFLRQSTKSELVAACMKSPTCRAKLERIQKGQLPALLPAASGMSPEEQELKKLPAPPSVTSPIRPRSGLMPDLLRQLYSWLNPFGIAVAQAQSGFSVFLTPASPFVQTPFSLLHFYGVIRYSNGRHILNPNAINLPQSPVSENTPYLYIQTTLPKQGAYLIDVTASFAQTKLRHQSNGPILDSWNYGPTSCPNMVCHYVTVEYFAPYSHQLYFWATNGGAEIHSVTIESFP
jgi:hypothetical protein